MWPEIVILFIFVIFGWLLVAPVIAYKQSVPIIDAIYAVENDKVIERRKACFDEVDFYDHIWRVVFFRDPYALYCEELVRDAKAGKKPYWETRNVRVHP